MRVLQWTTTMVLLVGLCLQTMAAEWAGGVGFRYRELTPELSTDRSPSRSGFTLMTAAATGMTFTNLLTGDAFLTNAVAHNGAGVAIGDVDGDGRPDLYFCSLQGANRMYRNVGQWRFEPLQIGPAACPDQLSTGAALVDVDGDRDLDLIVNGIASGTRLFINDGSGRWEEKRSGLARTSTPMSMALADIDSDGDLDLYCAQYIDVMHLADPTTKFALARKDGQWTVLKVNGQSTTLPPWKGRFEALPDGRVRELPEADALYLNDGQGGFTPVQDSGVFQDERGEGIPPFRDWGLSVMLRDLNGDGAPDIYVCNDNASPDRIWLNTGQGKFRPAPVFMFRHTSRSSMALDIADVNRDGVDDIFVLDMLAREHAKRMAQLVRDHSDLKTREQPASQPRFNRNTLFLGQPGARFVETALLAGVAASDWSWCATFVDVDLDGFEDLLITNGFSFDVMDQDSHDQFRLAQRQRQLSEEQMRRARRFHPPWPTRNAAFRNRGDGTFEPAAERWKFDQEGVSYGMALGDLDGDGDLDVVMNNLNAPPTMLRNEASGGRVAVRLKGLPPNTAGVGARIHVLGGPAPQSQEIIAGGRYLSSDEPLRVFAARAGAGAGMRIEVTWRTGRRSVVEEVAGGRMYEIEERPSDTDLPLSSPQRTPPFFAEASPALSCVHRESDFDDWGVQPLLPRRLSRLGPALCWSDLDGDGWEDLVVSAARGAKCVALMNARGQQFQTEERGPTAVGDQTGVVTWDDAAGNRRVVVGISNYEMGPGQESQVALLPWRGDAAAETLTVGDPALGPIAVGDLDGDGDLDLFAGGRFAKGRYPEPVPSTIWINDRGQLRKSVEHSAAFADAGLITGAAIGDLDGDGTMDVALSTEWGPPRVYLNRGGELKDATGEVGLATHTGWWMCIALGDFDGDGRLDLAAGNWGRNSTYELYQPSKLRAWYGQWGAAGRVELLEAWQKGDRWLPVHDRTFLSGGCPELLQRFSTHAQFGQADLPAVLGERFATARFVEAAELESAVFLNRGTRFERAPLPQSAQFAPVMALAVGDLDGDGFEDLFLAQNFFGSVSDLSREDNGSGLWLRGDGRGSFQPVPATMAGIQVTGEQRAVALADFNHDGKVDVAIGQNNGPARLFVNRGAAPGMRVRLSGSSVNRSGIGAILRLVYEGERLGPCRLVKSSAPEVLGLAGAPKGLRVVWPWGRQETFQADEGLETMIELGHAPK